MRTSILRKIAAVGVMTTSAVFASVPDAQANASAFLVARFALPSPKAAKDLCDRYNWACAEGSAKATLAKEDLALVKKVNLQVNRNTRPVSDQSQYGRVEYWALPTRRGGDCEDIALLKKRELIKNGIAPNALLLATALDRNKNGHAVLIARTDQGDVVLDNLTNRIKTWQATGYTFLAMQNPDSPNSWVGVLQKGK